MTNNEVKTAISIMTDSILCKNKYDYTCYDVVVEFYERCYGITLPTYNYNTTTNIPPDEVYKLWHVYYDVAQLQPGDVVVYASNLCDGGVHLAVYITQDKILNSDYNRGVTLDYISGGIIKYYAKYKARQHAS